MHPQVLGATVLVSTCFFYASWILMPQIVRRWLMKYLLRLPLPTRWIAFLKKAAEQPASCACSGCNRTLAPTKDQFSAPASSQKEKQLTHRLIFQARKKQN